jgi:peptide/nickel transport system substrate-binding protein
LLGWTPSTADAHDALYNLMATPTEKGQGQYNLGAYSNAKLDDLTTKIQTEVDKGKRDEMIREAFKIHLDDFGHIPLHQQALAWAYNKNVTLTQLPTNYMYFKWVTMKAPSQ